VHQILAKFITNYFDWAFALLFTVTKKGDRERMRGEIISCVLYAAGIKFCLCL
jgi:hypothetical protein